MLVGTNEEQKKEPLASAYELGMNIRRCILMAAAESISYPSWTKEFAGKNVQNSVAMIKNATWYRPLDPNELTESEAKELGFQPWSDDAPMLLIPLWLFQFLPDSFTCCELSGKEHVCIKAEMSADHRFGFLAYGVIPKKSAP